MSDMKLRIVHLYPDLLNLYGDKGNIECMRKRLEWRGIEAEICACVGDEAPDFSSADIVFLGGGGDREQSIVCEKLGRFKDELLSYIENDGVLVAACGGYELLGKIDGNEYGLGILDITTNRKEKRLIGDCIIKSELCDDLVVGFVNHGGRLDIGAYQPFGRVINGFGNDDTSEYEGIIYKNVIATYLHGPLLPKNPKLCDVILERALKKKYAEFSGLEALDDSMEISANNYIVNKLEK